MLGVMLRVSASEFFGHKFWNNFPGKLPDIDMLIKLLIAHIILKKTRVKSG